MNVYVLIVDTYKNGTEVYICKTKAKAFSEAVNYDISIPKLLKLKRSGSVNFGDKDQPSNAKIYETEIIE